MKLVYDTTDLAGIHAVFWPLIVDLSSLWTDIVGYELHILHGLDGDHSRFSRHYQGCAIDVRTWANPTDSTSGQITGADREALTSEVQRVLGKNFWLLDHGTHFHIAFKPEDGAWTLN